MKYFKYLTVMIFAVMLSVSCGSDDSSSDASSSALIGIWGITATEEGMEINVKVTFNSDKSGKIVTASTFEGETYTENESFTWNTSGNKLTISSSGEPDEVLTYSISGNKLTITDEDGEVTVLTKQ